MIKAGEMLAFGTATQKDHRNSVGKGRHSLMPKFDHRGGAKCKDIYSLVRLDLGSEASSCSSQSGIPEGTHH